MGTFINNFVIPSGIGWRNALGIALKQYQLMPERFYAPAAPKALAAFQKPLSNLQPDPRRIDQLFNVLATSSTDDNRHRSARMMLGIYRLSALDIVSASAHKVLDEITLGVMFYEAEHDNNFTEAMGMEEGNRYAAVSTFLRADSQTAYEEAQELRTDNDLLQSEDVRKVEFAVRAYASLIPLFVDAAMIEPEIGSIMNLAMDKTRSKPCRDAAIRILHRFEVHHRDILTATALHLAQELRRESMGRTGSRRWEDMSDTAEDHGFVSMWLARGSKEVLRELEAWRRVFRMGNSSLVMRAATAASFLIYRLPEGEAGLKILKEVTDEAFRAIEHDEDIDAACEAAAQLMPHIVMASEMDPTLTTYIATRLRELAQVLDAPELLSGAYHAVLTEVHTGLLDDEAIELKGIADNPSQPREMRHAAQDILLSVLIDD